MVKVGLWSGTARNSPNFGRKDIPGTILPCRCQQGAYTMHGQIEIRHYNDRTRMRILHILKIIQITHFKNVNKNSLRINISAEVNGESCRKASKNKTQHHANISVSLFQQTRRVLCAFVSIIPLKLTFTSHYLLFNKFHQTRR